MSLFNLEHVSRIAAAFTEDDKQIAALRDTCTALRASLQEYVDYDLLSSDCPNCYMCNEGRTEDDTGQCIHQKAAALLAKLEPLKEGEP